jgi:phage tail sheath protein FI
MDEAVQLRSFAEFEHHFGPLNEKHELGWAVWLFFQNGGREAWVVRVRSAPSAATVSKSLSAFDVASAINSVVLPGLARRDYWDAALKYCARRKAFFIADTPLGVSPADLSLRLSQLKLPRSPSLAVYYPWLKVANPHKPGAVRLCAPSGAIAGLLARTDEHRGVWKAPAGSDAQLVGVQDVEYHLAQDDMARLNGLGINVIREVPTHGFVAWGARTYSADTDAQWKYVAVRRLSLYIEASIEQGTQWAAFEPNGEKLWQAVRKMVEDFLHTVWRDGALVGNRANEAYFVKCDRTTMTQSDIENGRLIVQIGIAPVKPAEFVIIRIVQRTAARDS